MQKEFCLVDYRANPANAQRFNSRLENVDTPGWQHETLVLLPSHLPLTGESSFAPSSTSISMAAQVVPKALDEGISITG